MPIQTLRLIVFTMMTVVVMLFFYTSEQKTHYQRTAITAVNQILSEISTWEKEALLRNLAPEATQTISESQLEELLRLYRPLGRYHSIDDLDFSRTMSAFSLIGEKRVNYSGTVYFDAGLVNVNITLVQRDGFYLIYNFSLTGA